MKTYVNAAVVTVLVGSIAASFFSGRALGVSSVQQKWDEERATQAEADRSQVVDALEESRRLAAAAQEKNAELLDRAVRASEERQAARMAQAVRMGVLEAATRQGAYTAPECVLDDETFQALQEQLR